MFFVKSTVLLVIGNNYRFTTYELQRLKKQRVSLHHCDNNEQAIREQLGVNWIDGIVLNDDELDDVSTSLITEQRLKDVPYLTVEHFMETYLRKLYVPDNKHSLQHLDELRPYSLLQIILKRIIDYLFSIPLLCLFLLTALITRYKTKSQSPGSVFFKQTRVGKGQKEFECVKFRSMHEDAEVGGTQFASSGDDRVFSWGKHMRKMRIDEIPQLINIVKGEMHLIGPRPERKYWIEQFEENIPFYNERHLNAPGITGWAQVMYPYGANEYDAQQKLMYDLYYIKHWSLKLELEIIIKTIKVIFGKEGI